MLGFVGGVAGDGGGLVAAGDGAGGGFVAAVAVGAVGGAAVVLGAVAVVGDVAVGDVDITITPSHIKPLIVGLSAESY